MSYSTLAEIKLAIPKSDLVSLTDDERSGDVVTARVDEAIAKADNLIDSYLRGKHTLPLTAPVDDVVRGLSVDLAVYYLYQRRHRHDMPDSIMESKSDAMKLLKDFQAGKALLDTPAEVPNTGGIYKSAKTTSDQVFNPTELAKFQ
jgi:phage gp36-like protein